MKEKPPVQSIDRTALPYKYPTHAHDALFWESLGRAVATFGFLEDVLFRAVFALTATTRHEDHELAAAYDKWIQTLEKAATASLLSLICEYESAFRKHTDADVQDLDALVSELKDAAILRNVICHGCWGPPDATGKTVPSFIDRKMKVFATPIDAQWLLSIQQATTQLACSVIETVTHRGLQFPGSTGHGEPVWSKKEE